MNTFGVRSGLVAACLTLLPACGGAAPAGGGGSGGGPGPLVPLVVADWYVDANTGSDLHPGTFEFPFKTITHALAGASAGQAVYAAPGLYDTANGEVFPIEIPADVTLLGDEPNKGEGVAPTFIRGGGQMPPPYVPFIYVAVLMRSGSVMAGFRVTNDVPPGAISPYGVSLPDPGATLRNNAVRDSPWAGIYVFNDSGLHVITGNRIVDNFGGPGLAFISGGVGSRVEFNVISGNAYGVEYDGPGGDLGGGPTLSAGGNTITCNTTNDVWTANPITIDALFNQWDHFPPTIGTATEDIYAIAGAVVNVGGASLASTPCP